MFCFSSGKTTKRLLEQLLVEVEYLRKKEQEIMAIAQQILDAVTAETTVVNSILALIEGWKQNNLITDEQAATILTEIKANSDLLEAAVLANATE